MGGTQPPGENTRPGIGMRLVVIFFAWIRRLTRRETAAGIHSYMPLLRQCMNLIVPQALARKCHFDGARQYFNAWISAFPCSWA
jgi:hypothetical protein